MYDDWPELEEDGRMLVGLISPDKGPALHEIYRAARELFDKKRYVAFYQHMRAFIQQVEPMLEEGVINTQAGPICAHSYLAVVTGWVHSDGRRELATPQQARELWQRLDDVEAKYNGEKGVAAHILKLERRWRIDVPLAAYRELRAILGRAIERQWWFVWLRDRY